MKIGIIGHGFVGKATDYGFNTKSVQKFVVDPNYHSTVEDMVNAGDPKFSFIAVPTPMNEDGSINSSIIESVFNDLVKHKSNTIAIVKSTVTPDVISKLEKIYPRMVYNPEFLTERNANEDFVNAEFLIIGGNSPALVDAVEHLYVNHSMCKPCPVHKVDLQAASMIKYTLNCFMATKVLFFNQIKDLFDKSGTSTPWGQFTGIIGADSRMGKTHMSVHGPDGRKGFGGACFTKDTAALITYANKVGTPFTSLEEVVSANQEIRNQYSELDEREKEQNVNYNFGAKTLSVVK